MANPQLEDGYTPIANEILDALARIRVPGCARQVLDVIIRKTYGWGKKADRISLSQLSEATRLSRVYVVKARHTLEQMNLIKLGVTQKGNGTETTYWFNKDYETWKVLPKRVHVTQKGNGVLPNRVIRVLPNRVHTKDIYTKETNTKESMPRLRGGSEPVQFWMGEYQDKIGRGYVFRKKDGVAIAAIVKAVGLDEFKRMARWILTTPERFYCDNRTPSIILSKINDIPALIDKPPTLTRQKGFETAEAEEAYYRDKRKREDAELVKEVFGHE
jgi:phage replication O-like protein O